MQEGASAQHLLSQEPCTCCAFFQAVSLDSLRAPKSPHLRQQPSLVFPSEHRSQPSSTFSILVQGVLYTVQSIVFYLDLWMDPQHLGQCLAPQQTAD